MSSTKLILASPCQKYCAPCKELNSLTTVKSLSYLTVRNTRCSTVVIYKAKFHHHHHEVVLFTRSLLSLFLHPSLLFIAPVRSSKLHPVSAQHFILCWSASVSLSGPKEKVSYESILISPDVPSMSCSSYLNGLYGESRVVVQLLFCSVLLRAYVKNSTKHYVVPINIFLLAFRKCLGGSIIQ